MPVLVCHLCSRGQGGERGAQVRNNGEGWASPRCCLWSVKRAVCPFLFLFPLSPFLGSGTRCLVSFRAQPGNSAGAAGTEHSFLFSLSFFPSFSPSFFPTLYRPSLPPSLLPPFPSFLLTFLPPFYPSLLFPFSSLLPFFLPSSHFLFSPFPSSHSLKYLLST